LHVRKRQGVKGCKRSRQAAFSLTTLANTRLPALWVKLQIQNLLLP